MFKAWLFPVSMALINSIAGGIYLEKFLERRWKKSLTMAAWILLYFISQILVSNLTENMYRMGGAVRVVLQIFILLFMQAFLFHRDIFKYLFASFSLIAGTEIIKYIVSVCLTILADVSPAAFLKLGDWGMMPTIQSVEMWGRAFEIIILCTGVLVYGLLLVVYLRVVSRKFVRKAYQIGKQENAFLLLPEIAALSITITLRRMMLDVENEGAATVYEKIPDLKFWIPFISILLLGMIVSSVVLFQKIIELSEEEKKRVILENQMKQMHREVREIQEIYDDMRGLRHDMRNHLGNIAAYVRKLEGRKLGERDGEELTDYIGKMEDTISRLDFAHQTGNPITDIIIGQKSQQAAKKRITFQADFAYPIKQQIDAYDMGIILSNALENAIEACEKVEGEKEIVLHSFLKGNLFFIEISNDFSGELSINEETGLPVSNKKDKGMHGIGMSNILRCARKYLGDMDFLVSEAEDRKKFCITIMMNGNISRLE